MDKIMMILLAVLIVAVGYSALFAEGEKIGEGDFVSSTISDVFDKLNQYSSGKKHILYTEEELNKEDNIYDRDALGRKVQAVTIRSGKGLPPMDNEGETEEKTKK